MIQKIDCLFVVGVVLHIVYIVLYRINNDFCLGLCYAHTS